MPERLSIRGSHFLMETFFDAIETGDIDAVRKHLELDGSLANSVDCRTTPIDPSWQEEASRVRDGSIDKPPKKQLPRTDTALHVAAWHLRTDIARLLLDFGAEVNAVNNHPYTALHCALLFSHRALNMELIELLVARGANVNAKSKLGDVPIAMAFGWRRDPLPAIELFLRHGANINATSQQGQTALDRAMIFLGSPGDHAARVEYLLRNGANVNPPRRGKHHPSPPLCMAARSGNAPVARLLIEYGADINAPDAWGPPLLHAARKGHDKIVGLLLGAGADPRAVGHQAPLDAVRPFEEALDHFEKVLAER